MHLYYFSARIGYDSACIYPAFYLLSLYYPQVYYTYSKIISDITLDNSISLFIRWVYQVFLDWYTASNNV